MFACLSVKCAWQIVGKDCAAPHSPKKNLGILERHGATYVLEPRQ